MIVQGRRLFGLSLATRRQRRRLVVVYGLLLLGLGVFSMRFPSQFLVAMAAQALTFGGLLGGIQSQGPIKLYEPGDRMTEDPSLTTSSFPVQTLNLEGHLPTADSMLDEREHAERDRAHYQAYRVLRWAVPAFALVLVYSLWMFPAPALRAAPGALWLATLLVLSLPQIVILWTDPEEPAGELTVLQTAPR